MIDLPEQRPSYPYAPMGYDIKTMCKTFAGYGGDVVSAGGIRVTSFGQLKLGMNFLKTLQRNFGDWTVNEITSYCFIMNTTIVGNLVGVKDVAHELNMPMSTASHTLLTLEKREVLQAYPCLEDKRRKWLRLHPKIVAATIRGDRDIWGSQRRLLAEVLVEGQQ